MTVEDDATLDRTLGWMRSIPRLLLVDLGETTVRAICSVRRMRGGVPATITVPMPLSSWLTSRVFKRRRLRIPERFNRNSARVTALMPPEQSGRWLLERMGQHVGVDSYTDKAILDFGCGVRFSQAILNTGFKVGSYVGVDNYREMIEFLQSEVRDSRFAFHHLDAYHPLYNKTGQPMSATTTLPIAEGAFDIACMFSVITHQNPTDSESIFRILRRHIAPNGSLFFTYFADASIETFEDRSQEQNGGICFYHPDFLCALVERSGWRKVGAAAAEGPLIGDAFVFRPE